MDTKITEAFINEFNEWKTSFQKKGIEKLKEVFVSFWESNPGVNVVVWTQYTPYFMDGDPCEFSVNEPTFSNATEGDDGEEDDIDHLNDGEYDGENEDVWAIDVFQLDPSRSIKYSKLSKVSGADTESMIGLSNFITSEAMEDILKNVLGSDHKIIATREGFKIQDYSHFHD
jgi:hypothetical protein